MRVVRAVSVAARAWHEVCDAVPRVRVVLVLCLLGGSGCVTVKPWQREDLARPSMTVRFGEAGVAGEYRGKVVESKTAAGLPGDAPGGGCGCTQ